MSEERPQIDREALDREMSRLQEELERTRDFMASRGPDGSGVWISGDGSVALGHRRLAIIDLSVHGHQPMVSTDGRTRTK